jgi:hypothetical protein
MFSKIVSTTGALLMLHAAYSLQHYRSLVQDLEESATGISSDVMDEAVGVASEYRIPPTDVYIEMILSFVLLLLSELTRTGSSLQPVVSPQKPMVAPPYVSRTFDIYTTRSKGFLQTNR